LKEIDKLAFGGFLLTIFTSCMKKNKAAMDRGRFPGRADFARLPK